MTIASASSSNCSSNSSTITQTKSVKVALTSVQKYGKIAINNVPYGIKSTENVPSKSKPKKLKIKNKLQNKVVKPTVNSEEISICLSGSRYSVIGNVAQKLRWQIVREKDLWNVCWTDGWIGVDICRTMKRFQRVNHFPGMFEISRKDLLARNMTRMLKMFPNEYKVFPRTWCLPADYGEVMQFMKACPNKTYILKPDLGAQGRGISLTKSLKDIDTSKHLICQLYISRPLLIDGFKFDLRVYVLITSVEPLRIYIYNEGLARFATTKYQKPFGNNKKNLFMHLTNYAVNKHSVTFSKDNVNGSKRKFETLNRLLSAQGHNIKKLWDDIDDIVIKTILSIWPSLKHNYAASFPNHDIMQACFELLGIDILIDEKLRPWLLEVNQSPSFHTDAKIDREVKSTLIYDTFKMLNLDLFDKKQILIEDKQRVTNRLLQKIQQISSRKANKDTGVIAQANEPAPIQCNFLHHLQCEEMHMGGYRRVFPDTSEPDKYQKFFHHQKPTSIYAQTILSKKRECAAINLRQKLADAQEKMSTTIPKIQKRHHPGKITYKQYKPTGSVYWIPDKIVESEERERLSLQQQRDYLVKMCSLKKSIYLEFNELNLFNGDDWDIYCKLFNEPKRSAKKLQITNITFD